MLFMLTASPRRAEVDLASHQQTVDCNRWVRDDSVAYYAFAGVPLIEHGFDQCKRHTAKLIESMYAT